jgi:hypothetical protein
MYLKEQGMRALSILSTKVHLASSNFQSHYQSTQIRLLDIQELNIEVSQL